MYFLLFFSLFFVIPLSVYAEESPALMLLEVSPSATPDTVTFICNQQVDLSEYIIGDMDGTDTPLSSIELLCNINQKVTVYWGEGVNTYGENMNIYLADTPFTNTKDQIVIQKIDGIFIDAVVYWDGESDFNTASELTDIQNLINVQLWDTNLSISAAIIPENIIFERIENTHTKEAWQEKISEDTEVINEEVTEENDTESPDIPSEEENIDESEIISETLTEESENISETLVDETENTIIPVTQETISPPIISENIEKTPEPQKSIVVFSPQIVQPTLYNKVVPERPRIIITSLSPQDTEKDNIIFYNTSEKSYMISDYALYIKGKKQKLPNTAVPSKSSIQFNIDLPNTNANILYGNSVYQQSIEYKSSLKGKYYVLNTDTGLWEWNDDISKDTFSKKIITPRIQKEISIPEEPEEKEIEDEQYVIPSPIPIVEASENNLLNEKNETQKTNIWWYIGIIFFSIMLIALSYQHLNSYITSVLQQKK